VSARRLNDSEKKKIVNIYRESSETAMSLAEQFGVSNTTISRILKAGIESDEYDRLVQQKRRGGDHASLDIAIPMLESAEVPSTATLPATPKPVNPKVLLEAVTEDLPKAAHPSDETTPSGRRIRRRTTAEPQSLEPQLETQGFNSVELNPIERQAIVQPSITFPIQTHLPLLDIERIEETQPSFESSNKPVRKVIQVGVVKRQEPELLDSDDDDDDILPPVTEEISAILGEDFDDGDDEDDDEQDDEQDDYQEDDEPLAAVPSLHVEQFMQVLPLAQASIPRVCYLVVDRSAELVLRPLKDFGDMGQLPPGREQVLTLPIFDNPRVAKRFANVRTERVIKIPDSQIFTKTADKLLAKGITYLYIDGQLYSL
jgi:hypothetical protein